MIMPAEQACPAEQKALLSHTEDFFSQKSPLHEAEKFGGRPYEYRPQQAAMAHAVAEALCQKHNLCVEAPTGVGKSFAYLMPAILFSINVAHKPVVVSTETINLQEQLIEKDLPLLRQLMGVEFKTALAKGRSNYLCQRRLGLAAGDRREEFLPMASLASDIDKIARWAQDSKDGSRSSLDIRVEQHAWSSVCCEGGNCAGPQCSFFRNCFYWRARREWDKADVVVANHALFFTDLKLKQGADLESSLLPPYCAAIIDEAHTLEDNAASYLGLDITDNGVRHFLNRLYNPANARGLLMRAGEEALGLRKAVSAAQDRAISFFQILRERVTQQNDSICRLRKPGSITDLLSEPLASLAESLKDYIKLQDDEDFKTELNSQFNRALAYAQGIFQFATMSLPEHVYWLEEEHEHNSISMYAAPLNVNEILKKLLFTAGFPVILTSATLTVRHSLAYYRERVGFANGPELVLDSPFDHQEQVRLYIPRQMPEPNEESYIAAAASQIERFVTMTHGKAFVLFTSYQNMRTCAELLEGFFKEKGITLLVQGENMTRSAMLREFRRDTNSVIFGANSFWTGVDVPGEALSNVIITKLPFPVPSHPLIEARSERIKDSGKSPFMDYSLPEAVLKFRQGLGRLIRSKTDKGIIVVLDKRIISKRYGEHFLQSIPRCPTEIC